MYIFSKVPRVSYYMMSATGEPPAPKVEVSVEPAPSPPANAASDAELAALRADLEAIEERLDAVSEEGKEWAKMEIAAALSRLENLEATAKEGITNLAAQITKIQARLQDLLTRKSQEPQPGPVEIVQPVTDQTPPASPPAGPKEPEGEPEPEGGAGPRAPKTGPAKRRVI